jgi:hypothetical protein
VKRHTSLRLLTAASLAGCAVGICGGWALALPHVEQADQLQYENWRLQGALDWYDAIHADKPPPVVVGMWQ